MSAEGALAHDHEHVVRLQPPEQPAEPLLPRHRALLAGGLKSRITTPKRARSVLLDSRRHVVTGDDEPHGSRTSRSCLPPVPVALKLLETLGASDRVVAGSCTTLAAVGAAAGVDPPGVAVVNSPMSAPPDRLPFSRVERGRALINRIVTTGGAAASTHRPRPRRCDGPRRG